MPLTVQCPGCHATLAAPDHLAGRAVRCTRCGQPMLVPAVVDAVVEPPRLAPVRVVSAPTPVASPKADPPSEITPPTRKRPRRNEPDDDADERLERRSARRPRSKPRRGFPVWIPVATGAALLLLAGLGAGVYFALGDGSGRGPLGSAFDDGWVTMEPKGTLVAWEFPTEPALGANGIGGGVPQMGENVYACELKQPGRDSIVFAVVITRHALDKPGHGLDDFTRFLHQQKGANLPNVVRTYEIHGRTAVLTREPIAEKVHLLVTEPGKAYQFEVFGPGVTEHHPDVKRFLDSIRFAD